MMNRAFNQNINQESYSDEWLQRTQLFVRWKAMKQEILLHKWYESEKAGHDVGWERAATSWMIHYGRCLGHRNPADSTHQA